LIAVDTENLHSVSRLGSCSNNVFCFLLKVRLIYPTQVSKDCVNSIWFFCETCKHCRRQRVYVWCNRFGFVV